MSGMARGADEVPSWGRRPTKVDATIVVALAGAMFVLPLVTRAEAGWPDFLLTAVTALALWQMRRWPYLALFTTGVATALTVGGDFGLNLSGIGFVIAVFAFAFYSTRLRTLVVALGMTLVFGVAAVVPLQEGPIHWHRLSIVLSLWTVFTLALGVQAVRTIVRARTERVLRAQEAREEEARRRLVEERVHIAREIHDVIAHHVALVGVQAAVAQKKVELGDGDAAIETMQRVRTSTKTVLSELQNLLSVLRTEGQAAPTAPVPGVKDVAALADTFQGTGTRVEVRMPEAVPALTPSADIAAYRLVQEALTNVQKHAPGASAVVEVITRERALDVTVTNSPAAARGRDTVVAGFGLRGMDERIRAIGGRVDSGPTRDGGFRVRASIPYGESFREEERP